MFCVGILLLDLSMMSEVLTQNINLNLGEHQEYIDLLFLSRQSLQSKQCFHNQFHVHLSAARNTILLDPYFFRAKFSMQSLGSYQNKSLLLPSEDSSTQPPGINGFSLQEYSNSICNSSEACP